MNYSIKLEAQRWGGSGLFPGHHCVIKEPGPMHLSLYNVHCVGDSLPGCKMVVEIQHFKKEWFPALSFSQSAKQNILYMSLARVMSLIHI